LRWYLGSQHQSQPQVLYCGLCSLNTTVPDWHVFALEYMRAGLTGLHKRLNGPPHIRMLM
jgi:hypothetical protein